MATTRLKSMLTHEINQQNQNHRKTIFALQVNGLVSI